MTISGTGSSPVRTRGGFTLMEVLLVLGLIAIVAGMFAVNFEVLITEFGNKQPIKVFQETVKEARIKVVERHRPVVMRFDNEKKLYQLLDFESSELLYERSTDDDVALLIEPYEIFEVRLGYFINKRDLLKEPLDKIVFFTDGTSTAVSVVLVQGQEEIRMQIDSFSAALFLQGGEE